MNQHMVDSYGRTAEERADLRAKVELLNKVAAERWDDESWRKEMAQEITETIYRGFEHENLLGLMTTLENAPFDGRVFIKEVRGLRAFWVARGGYIEASTMRANVMELPRDTIGFHVYEFEDKLRTNFAETQATLVDSGIERMDAEVNLRFFRALQAAVPDGSDQYIDGNGISLTALNTALAEVRDQSRDFNVTIVGRTTMTDQIIDELLNTTNGSGFIPETNEQMIQRGVLGNYRGARIVTLQNYLDDQEIPFFPANEMFVLARDASKFAFWGGLLSKEFTEQDNWYWHYLARRDFGGVVHRPNRIRRIVDNSIAAYAGGDSFSGSTNPV
jgi:hypothetical protein